MKQNYQTPTAEALEVKIEGVICGSNSGTAGMQNYNWNDITEE